MADLEGYHILAVRRRADVGETAAWYRYVNDHLPTPRKVVDDVGDVVWDARMEPFGTTEELAHSIEQPVRFPGQVETPGHPLICNGLRSFVPAIGRYVAADPAARCCPRCAPTMSSYSYASNAVLGTIDPSGGILEYVGCSDELKETVEEAIREASDDPVRSRCEYAQNLHALLDRTEQTITIKCIAGPLLDPTNPKCLGHCGSHGECGAPPGGIVLTSATTCKLCLPRTLFHELIEMNYVSGPEEEVWRLARNWAAFMTLPPRCFLEGP